MDIQPEKTINIELRRSDAKTLELLMRAEALTIKDLPDVKRFYTALAEKLREALEKQK